MMKKKISVIFLLLAFGYLAMAQNGMPQWAFPGSNPKLFDQSTGTVSNLPQGPNSIDYQGGVPKRGYANFTDDSGNLSFFVVDNAIYDKDGYLISDFELTDDFGPFNSTTYPATIECDIAIVNVPGECEKYYIVLTNNADGNGGSTREGIYYLTLDMNAANRNYPSRLGALTNDHHVLLYGWTYKFARPIFLNSNPYHSNHERMGGYTINFTQPRNNQRYMYIAGQNNIERFTVTSSGFTHDNYDLDTYYATGANHYNLFAAAGGMGDLVDSDMILLPNGNYKLASTVRAGSGGWYNNSTWGNQLVFVIVATIDAQNGNFSNVEGLSFPSGNGQLVRGVEFSHNGRYVYASFDVSPYLYYADLNQTPVNNYYDVQPLNYSNAANFKRGNIERGFGGKLYFASANGLGELASSNNPNSTWNPSAFTFPITNRFGVYGDHNEEGYIISNQLSNENYNHAASASASLLVGRVSCPGNTYSVSLVGGGYSAASWSNGQEGGSSTTYTSVVGTNTIYVDLVNDFGCVERINYSFYVAPILELQLSANTYEYCPRNGNVEISYQVQFVDQGNRINYAFWTKDGQPYSNNVGPIIANGPGEYCLQVEDDFNGCLSPIQCVTITEGECTSIDPDFTFTKYVGKNSYTIDVAPVDTRSCIGRGWWVIDVTNGGWNIVHGPLWMLGGPLNYNFQFGKEYIIYQGMDSPCAAWTGHSRNVSQTNKMAGLEIGTAEFAVYPNPVKEVLNISTTDDFSMYTITNMQGQTIAKGQQRQLAVQDLSSGMYFISFFDAAGEKLTTKKFIKE